MPDATIPITAGAGTLVRVFQRGANDYDQYFREARGTAKGSLPNIPWAVTTTGLASVIAADVTRVGLILTSLANGMVWIRFDTTIPTSTIYDWYLNPGDRWEVPVQFTQLAISMAGLSAGGTILGASATCA